MSQVNDTPQDGQTETPETKPMSSTPIPTSLPPATKPVVAPAPLPGAAPTPQQLSEVQKNFAWRKTLKRQDALDRLLTQNAPVDDWEKMEEEIIQAAIGS